MLRGAESSTHQLGKRNVVHAGKYRFLKIGLAAALGGVLQACTSQSILPMEHPNSDDVWQGVALPSQEDKTSRKTDPVQPYRNRTRTSASGTVTDPLGLLPSGISDARGWGEDIAVAFKTLNIEPSIENQCAAIAVIAQESSFQATPTVQGLAHIIRNELEKRRAQYHIPKAVLEAALSVKSPDGRSYDSRIAGLRTENDLNRLYDDMLSELPLGKTLFASRNPIRTGGPMQVSVAFAEQFHQESHIPYPYGDGTSVRDEVFSRKGGVFFGIAYLLGYPVKYDQMIYRFADYNAGRYSSRNTGFQKTLIEVSGNHLALDGDLLRYDDEGKPRPGSETQTILTDLRAELGLSEAEIREDLSREKTPDFERTKLYSRLEALALRKGRTPIRPALPEIRLISPKITSGLTTQGFARKVESRYRQCLKRANRDHV